MKLSFVYKKTVIPCEDREAWLDFTSDLDEYDWKICKEKRNVILELKGLSTERPGRTRTLRFHRNVRTGTFYMEDIYDKYVFSDNFEVNPWVISYLKNGVVPMHTEDDALLMMEDGSLEPD